MQHDSPRPRCVFVGVGSWGRRLLRHVATAFDVAALVSTGRPESVAWSSRHYPELPHFDDLALALTLPAIDAVFLATPTPTHAELASRALEADCHVFVEKPLAVNPRDAVGVLTKAAARNLEVFVGYVYLFHPAFDFLRAAGQPRHVESLQFDWRRPHLAGNLHEELLCHDLAVGITLTGEVPHRIDVLEHDNSRLGCAIHTPSGRVWRSMIRIQGTGTKSKTVEVSYADGRAYRWRDDQLVDQNFPYTDLLTDVGDDPLAREVAAFRTAIEGARPRMTDDHALSVGISELLHQVSRSLHQ